MELIQKNRAGDFLLSEAPGTQSRENAILAEGENLEAGTVLGNVLDAAAAAAVGANGDGLITTVAVGEDVELGTYRLLCTAESANAGTFSVTTPSGYKLPDLTVGVAYTSTHINLTVADGDSDWNTSDVINVVVAEGNYAQLDPAGTDGTQRACAILYAGTDATAAETACVVVARQAEVKADALEWPAGISDAAKAAAVAQLKNRGILLR